MRVVRTRPSRHAEHGSHRTRWLAVLGVALVAGGIVLTVTAPQLLDEDLDVGTATTLAPYVLEPLVRLEPAAAEPPRPHPATAAPTRLIVPSLGVDAPVVRAQVSEGTLWPPDDPQTLGWWAEGARPGAVRGGALITGHTVHSGGGAFDYLETLRKGEVVRVRTLKGLVDYKVTGVTIYRKSSLAKDAERIFSQTVPGRLVLITCEDWNGEGYDSNAIVFAETQRS